MHRGNNEIIVASIDCEKYGSTCRKHKEQRFPSIRLYKPNSDEGDFELVLFNYQSTFIIHNIYIYSLLI